MIAGGAGHCFAVDNYSFVYSWGANSDYQTGHDVRDEDQINSSILRPRRVDHTLGVGYGGVSVKNITCGISHSVVLTSRNEILTFGCNENG